MTSSRFIRMLEPKFGFVWLRNAAELLGMVRNSEVHPVDHRVVCPEADNRQ